MRRQRENPEGRSRMRRLIAVLVCVAAVAACAEVVELRTAAASCCVELEGARITSFKVGDKELLWNAEPIQLSAKDWAHGGIPVCWPWFGVNEKGEIHGYAWRRRFCIRNRREGSDRSEMNLYLNSGGARLDYRIALSDVLTLELETINIGTNDFRFSTGFHPYFRVAERDRSTVSGLDGLAFEDDPSRPAPERGVWHGSLAVTASVDRIFRVLPKFDGARCELPFAAKLTDELGGGSVSVEAWGASDVNVWNPGFEKNCPGFVPSDEWRRFVCVEPILVGKDGFISLKTGEVRKVRVTLRRDR